MSAVLRVLEDREDEAVVRYLSEDRGYWLSHDVWRSDAEDFKRAGLGPTKEKRTTVADFRGYENETIKGEVKYAILYMMKECYISAFNIQNLYGTAIKLIGSLLASDVTLESITEAGGGGAPELEGRVVKPTLRKKYVYLKSQILSIVRDKDISEETDKDIWRARNICGIRQSATGKRGKAVLTFTEIPEYYRESVKRYMKRLIYRRSWSHCHEILVYIRAFYQMFKEHGYGDGFQEEMSRRDAEEYLRWVWEEHAHGNATYRSKAVLYIRNWLEFIQLSEYPQAPKKEVRYLIFDDDIPRRERAVDTMKKVKYIPEPVRDAIDAAIDEIEPSEMKPVYILLRETGWRGTDILNLRYDSCLEYAWNSKERMYVPYLCGEITKTGIPVLKIPVREEVADLLRRLIEKAKEKSTDENNPEKYLFNTYEGKNKGLPYRKQSFSSAVQSLIEQKKILDGEGEIYHFRAHSLRHTRALEYTEQGMPIGIIQQILGHCSLQMTLHYSQVSEDILFKKWKGTEKLDLFRPEVPPPDPEYQGCEDIHYERIRKSLDVVKVPFGMCMKPSKIACRQQMNLCLKCASFCTAKEHVEEYEAEIRRVKEQIRKGKEWGREDWNKKNREYLENLEQMRDRIIREGIVHKNGKIREDSNV